MQIENIDKNKVKDKQVKLEQLYMKAFGRKVVAIYDGSALNQCRDNLKRAVFYAVKYFSLERIDRRHSTSARRTAIRRKQKNRIERAIVSML